MHTYLPHLISDLRQAAQNLPKPPFFDLTEEEECLRGVMEYEFTEPKPMQEWFGIERKSFPPDEQLTEDELQLMVAEILRLWEAYHFYADLPEKLPARLAYRILTENFEKPVIWLSEGDVHIEFCDYEPEHCPFPEEFCRCRDIVRKGDFQEPDDVIGENSFEIDQLSKEIKEIEGKSEDDFLPRVDMVRYVNQLIADIHSVAEAVKQDVTIPDTPEARTDEDARQLVENPFVTLEELTGIGYAMFPEHIRMDGLQTRRLLKAMLELLDAFSLKVHFPHEVPHEIKYEALRDEWDGCQVKHLPISGDDIDLCTGDRQTCPFGEFCNCDEIPPDFNNNAPEPDPKDDIVLPF